MNYKELQRTSISLIDLYLLSPALCRCSIWKCFPTGFWIMIQIRQNDGLMGGIWFAEDLNWKQYILPFF